MRYLFSICFVSVLCITPILMQRARGRQGQNSYCITPDNYYGSCVPLTYCPQVVNIFQEVNAKYAQQYILALQRSCGVRSIRNDPVICCARPVNSQPTTEVTSTHNPFLPPKTQRPQTPVFIPPATTTTTSPPPTSEALTAEPQLDNRGTYCRGPDTREGVCVAIESCDELLKQLQAKQRDATFANFLRASNRICGNSGTKVCCPSTQATVRTPTTTDRSPFAPVATSGVFPSIEEGCGYTTNAYKKIVGGKVSKKGAWPWAALLGYDDGLSTSFKCGGTLVTARHVVTAAHCIIKGLASVRLGEHDLSTDTETQHIDIPVAGSEAHPQYEKRTGHSDIAIVYLKQRVDFTELISPICMPVSTELRSRSYVAYMPFVVGWGKTMEGGFSSDVLQELQIPVFENKVCESAYAKAKRFFAANQFDKAVLCAGVLSGGQDTCQGDSGGPLMFPEPYQNNVRFYLIGVVSYGIGCARPEIPGVYASVQYHIDWLTERIGANP